MIILDGRLGEGGGQILRTALSLSAITQQPFRIEHIRAKRSTPGLLRQHLACVNAAARVCHARVMGAELGATCIEFYPQAIQGGHYEFAVGSAGSVNLVLQTVLPMLLHAAHASTVIIDGGTHNPFAPPVDFLQRTFLPLLARMGARVQLDLQRAGFYPAGGGRITAQIQPLQQWSALDLPSRGKTAFISADAYIAAIPRHVAERELAVVKKQLQTRDVDLKIKELDHERGPGNMLAIHVGSEHMHQVFCGFGMRGVTAENVARTLCKHVKHYLASNAAVDEHLADQLILPMALAGSGHFSCAVLSEHTTTNIAVVKRFIDRSIVTDALDSGFEISIR